MTGQGMVISVGPVRLLNERLAGIRRWLPGSLGFLAATLPLLYVLRHFNLLPMWTATLVAGEVGIVAQFLANARWASGNQRPRWSCLVQHHQTSAGAFVSWWAATNALNTLGLEYLLACCAGVGASAAWTRGARTAARWPAIALADMEGAVYEIVDLAPAPAGPDAAYALESPPEPAHPRWSDGHRRGFGLPRHLLPGLFLVAATIFAFQQTLLFGYRFIGNSDRLNQYLSFILYHTHNLEQGRFAAWSEYMYNGFDSLSLPFSFFSPLFALPALLHTDDVVAVFGVVTPALLAVTLLEAYFLVHYFTRDRLASLAAACTYGFATYSLLKLTQNDQTFLSILTAPAFFYLVYTAEHHNWLRRYVALTLLVTIEFYFAFLQEFSYNVIFLVVYCGYLFLRSRIYPIAVFVAALASGALLSVPRLWAQYQTVAASGRGRAVATVADDSVGVRTLLRFFSRDIFGHSSSQNQLMPPAMHINLHEGDLVHSSVFGALLLVLIILSFRWMFAIRSGRRVRYFNVTVLILYIVFAFAVMHNTDAYLLIAALYQNISFQHGRIGVSALLPVALVTGLFLAQGRGRLGSRGIAVSVAASALIIGVSAVDFSRIQDGILLRAGLPSPVFIACNDCLPGLNLGTLLASDVLRFTTLAALFLGLVITCRFFGGAGRNVMKTVLAVSIIFQAVWGAADYLEGPQTREFQFPYEANDFVLGTADQFRPPSTAQLELMSTLLDNDHYRSVIICPHALTQPNCNASLGMSWGIRLVDGYLSGVPPRLGGLGWTAGVGGHELRFQQSADLDWRILSFLNARQAVVVSRELYMNDGLELPTGLQLERNPSPYVYPRAYFGQEIESVTTAQAQAAVRSNLKTCPPACDGGLQGRFPVDYVEGPVAGVFDPSGNVSLSGGGDRLTLQFPASADQRFLVVNEMWDPGWTAFVDGREVPVYPTNVVMRGVLVPEGAREVVLQYRSLLYWAWWYTPGLMAIGAVLLLVARRLSRRRSCCLSRQPSDLPAEPEAQPA